VVQHRLVIANDFLLDLEDVKILRHFLDLFTAKCVDQCRLTNTISTNKSIFSSSREANNGLIQESLSTGNHGDIRKVKVCPTLVTLVVKNSWWWNSLFGCHEFFDLLVQCILIFFQLLLVFRSFLLPPSHAIVSILVEITTGISTFCK